MKKTYKYVILIEGKPIAKGKNLKALLKKVEKKFPKKKITIRYEYPPGVLIA